jgi:periplasmic divalent cation tolerance protein
MEQSLLVMTNLADGASAQALARALVERRLAACVNLLPAVQSIYRWQGAVEEAAEVTLLIKTTAARYAELEQAIRALHPYELPEVIAVPVCAGLPAYLGWIAQETRKEIDV